MKSIEINKQYKENKKKLKQERKYALSVLKNKEKQKEKIRMNIIKQKEKNIEERQKYISRKAKKIVKKPNKVKIKHPKIKKLAFMQFQLYCKLSRAFIKGSELFVIAIDIMKLVSIYQCNAGHVYSKHNHPNLAFEYNNCRPITPETNEIQRELYGEWFINAPISENEKYKIHKKAEISKGKPIRSSYYREMYEYYRNLNKELIEYFRNQGLKINTIKEYSNL